MMFRMANIITATLPQSRKNSFTRRPMVPIRIKINAINLTIQVLLIVIENID